MTRLRGAALLLRDTIVGTTTVVERMHRWAAGLGYGPVRRLPGVGPVAQGIEAVHLGEAAFVYDTIRGVAGAVLGVAGHLMDEPPLAGDRSPSAHAAPPPVAPAPEPSTAAWVRDSALAAVNGAIGDRLDRSGNGLALEMGLRHRRRPLPVAREALAAAYPQATGRVCVLVHGLGASDIHWRLGAERHHGRPDVDFGTLLEAELGFTPLYLRYNSGLHVSDNGRRLADLLERLVDEWPVGLDEVLLLGHSMGGLVARSALHFGHDRGDRWVGRVRRLVCLGSPHLGAPLEKGAHLLTSLLRAIPVEPTRIVGEVIDARSAGVKDLRYGYVTDRCWQGQEADAFLRNTRSEVPFVPGVDYCFVASTVTRDPRHPLGLLIGDVLVRTPSASGRGERAFDRSPELEKATWRHVGGLAHLDLMVHPEVYAQIRDWCERQLPSGD